MSTNTLKYDLGRLVGNQWHQYATVAGQDCYLNLQTRQVQYEIPTGFGDSPSDTWTADTSKQWAQWRNGRTGRITRKPPVSPSPATYLEWRNLQPDIQLVERSPESDEFLYRRLMTTVLRFFFKEDEDFNIYAEESRGEFRRDANRPDMAVLKITSRPTGSLYSYDYCFIESKKANQSWTKATEQLGRHCAGTDNESRRVYAITQIGMFVQFFTAHHGQLTALSQPLHLRSDVHQVTRWFVYMKRKPIQFHKA